MNVAQIATQIAAPNAADVDRLARFPVETLEALKSAKLLSACLPKSLGGADISLSELAEICTTLGRACPSSAMIYAMHCIQLASIAHHTRGVPELEDYLHSVSQEQRLIGSITSEVGTGGDLRRSIACLQLHENDRFRFEKSTPTSSYCEYADDLLISIRRGPDASPSDQVLVIARTGDFVLSDVGEWDTLGMRGTCSPPAVARGEVAGWQVIPDPFRDIAPATMVPYSHVLWSSVWLGIAEDAFDRARKFLRIKSRKDPDGSSSAANRLAGLATLLNARRAQLTTAITEVESRNAGEAQPASQTGAVLAMNDLKLGVSESVVEIVSGAIAVIGIAAYQNKGDFSLGRHLRDAHSAALMINNDRIRSTNADLLLVYKGR